MDQFNEIDHMESTNKNNEHGIQNDDSNLD